MHDYDPQWDYPVTEIQGDDVKTLHEIEKEIRRRVLPALQFTNFKTFCVERGGFGDDVLGIFVDGTSSYPVVGLDLENIRAASDDLGIDWKDQIRATLVHELAHAYEEATGMDNHDETASEAFAHRYVTDGVVDVKVLQGKAAGLRP